MRRGWFALLRSSKFRVFSESANLSSLFISYYACDGCGKIGATTPISGFLFGAVAEAGVEASRFLTHTYLATPSRTRTTLLRGSSNSGHRPHHGRREGDDGTRIHVMQANVCADEEAVVRQVA